MIYVHTSSRHPIQVARLREPTPYLDWHALVLHVLHESVPFLYDNTVGDGPYNSWIDPILTGEWSMLAYDNMAQMQGFGMPGAFTHGNFDTWSPGYLMFLAAGLDWETARDIVAQPCYVGVSLIELGFEAK